ANKAMEELDLTFLSPRPYQVFQRQTRTRGEVLFSGRIKPDCDALEARLFGKALPGATGIEPWTQWRALPLQKLSRSFSVRMPVPAGGWYRVELRARKGKAVVAQSTVENVGVGEIFVGAGQSNSTNSGGEGKLDTASKMVSTFSGNDWRLATDPQPGAHDNSTGGSFYPAFGDALFARYHVPIGVAVTGHGGTSVNAWQPDGELFNWMMTRIHQLGPQGFRGVLWHQGESDVGQSAEEHAQKLTNVIRGSKERAGWEFPWFVAQVSYHNPENPSFPTTRAAHQKLWQTGIAWEGPDTDTLGGDNRDGGGKGIHFSPKGLTSHGKMWAEKVARYLDRVLVE
ncbi:MAG: eukaryotic-like serine/threonine-protein kinase, partial [Abditibacteriota bacterium]|nr:eukaryotic-like serine/threonine-protein kinase [Abditibacteriota bacterium]